MVILSCYYSSAILAISKTDGGYRYRYFSFGIENEKSYICSESFVNDACQIVEKAIEEISKLPIGPRAEVPGTAVLPTVGLKVRIEDSEISFCEEYYCRLSCRTRNHIETLVSEVCSQIDALAELDQKKFPLSFLSRINIGKALKGLLERYFK